MTGKRTALALAGVLLLQPASAEAQSPAQVPTRARTDTGREVILRPDGTWIFADQPAVRSLISPSTPRTTAGPAPPQPAAAQPPTITQGAAPPPTAVPVAPAAAAPQPRTAGPPITVQRPGMATAQLATRRGDFRVWYNPAIWRPAPEIDETRVELRHQTGQAVVVIIPEGTPLPLVALRTAAIENARRTASDARIVAEQTRRIANRDVLLLRIDATLDADNRAVSYLGHYYGDPRGSIQVVAATAQRDFDRLRPVLQDAIDGLDLNRP